MFGCRLFGTAVVESCLRRKLTTMMSPESSIESGCLGNEKKRKKETVCWTVGWGCAGLTRSRKGRRGLLLYSVRTPGS